jgi:hypothetical protein
MLLLVVTIVTTATSAGGEGYPDSVRANAMVAFQRLLFDDRFEAADSLAEEMLNDSPGDPAGYFCAGVSLLSRMFDREEEWQSRRFHRLLDSASWLATSRLKTADSSEAAWMHNFLGNVHSHRSLWEARFGSLATALRQARAARSEYSKGLEQDSANYDLFFGLGLYHYWKSAKAGILRSLGIFKDETRKGMAELRLAADSSLISKESAHHALIWIWLDRGEYDSTIAACHEMEAQYRTGKSFLWPMAAAFAEQSRSDSAAAVYARLREKLVTEPGNYYNLIECDYQLARCYEDLGRPDLSRAAAELVRNYWNEIPDDTRRRQRAKIAFLVRMAE